MAGAEGPVVSAQTQTLPWACQFCSAAGVVTPAPDHACDVRWQLITEAHRDASPACYLDHRDRGVYVRDRARYPD